MGIETLQPGVMAAGSTQSLFLKPDKFNGFWTGKFSPKKTKAVAPSARKNSVNDFHAPAMEEEVVRHFPNGPDEDEETIKSFMSQYDSKTLHDAAVIFFKSNIKGPFNLIKLELEDRAFKARLSQAVKSLGGADHAGAKVNGTGSQSALPAKKNKKVFEVTHGVSTEPDEEETSDEISEIDAKKSILTKRSEDREKKSPKAKPAAKARITSSKNGKGKTYNYPDKKKAKASPPKPGAPSQGAEPGEDPEAMLAPDPKRLADQLGLSVDELRNIAKKRSNVRGFITYFKLKAGAMLRKHKVPDMYLEEVYEALMNPAPAAQAQKSFVFHPEVYAARSPMRRLLSKLSGAGVTSRDELATFFQSEYRVSKSEAKKESDQMYRALKSEGALTTQ